MVELVDLTSKLFDCDVIAPLSIDCVLLMCVMIGEIVPNRSLEGLRVPTEHYYGYVLW